MEHASDRPILADLVDLSVQMDLDAAVEPDELRHRDRHIGQELKHLTGQPQSQLRHWLWQVTEGKHGDNAVKTIRLVTLILFFFGSVVGWITALGVFAYDGSALVNIVNVLAVFVGLQLLLLFMSVVIALPQSLLRFIPGGRPLQDLFGALSPGRLIAVIARFLSPEHRLAVEAALGRQKSRHRIYGQVRKWLVLQLSQVVAVAFNVGALISCLYLVTISDLAFGWSTTLEFQAENFHWLIEQLAWPWRGWFEAAVPSVELIEATRFYRLDGGMLPNAMKLATRDVVALGRWWEFLLMCILFYGLLPRLLILVVARWRLRAALNNAFIHMPGASQVLDRMNHALVETSAVEPETRLESPATTLPTIPVDSRAAMKGYLINWAGVNANENHLKNVLQLAMAVKVDRVLHAGGRNPIEHDQRIIEELRATAEETSIIVVVKSWEPPILDFLDFLEALRSALVPGRVITVVPVSLSHDQRLVSADPHDLEMWQKRLQSLGDPWLDCQPLSSEVN